jgi:tetratricopeptide (TPR) repeat protein
VVPPRSALLLSLTLLAVAAAYLGALDVGYVWDDHVLIEQNPNVRAPSASWSAYARDFWAVPLQRPRAANPYFRPLVALSYAADWATGGGSPLPFHLSNVLGHLGVVALVFALARQLGASPTAATMGAALFGLFPRLTESVTWISGRTDVAATLAVSMAALVELRAPGRRLRRVGVGALLLVGLLCKEVALVGAGALLLYGVLRVRSGKAPAQVEAVAALPIFGALGLWGVLRAASVTEPGSLVLHAPSALMQSLGQYVLMLLTPWCPSAQIGHLGEPRWELLALGAGLIGVAGALVARLWRRGRLEEVSLLLGGGAGLALASVVVLGVSTIASDRFLYLPLAWGAAALARWLGGARWRLVGAALLAASFAPATWARNRTWGSEVGFWRHTLATASPRNPGPRVGLGDALSDRHRYQEALVRYLEAEALEPTDSIALSVAVTLSRLGRDTEAETRLSALARAQPSWKRVALDGAVFRARALDLDGALAALDEVERRFGADEALSLLRGSWREAKRSAEALGGGRRDESLAERAARARLYDGLGATGKARSVYAQLSERPDAPAELQVRASSWLVLQGEPQEARAALARLEALLEAQSVLPSLRAIYEERMADGDL